MYITGPINAARLEGNINNKKKVIYLFMDYHEDVEAQTGCNTINENIKSIHIVNYLKSLFDRLRINDDTVYHIFAEIDKYYLNKVNYDKYGRYIDTIDKLFSSIFNFNDIDKNIYNSKDFSLDSETYKNIKLHFIDIRSAIMLDILEPIYAATLIIPKLINNKLTAKDLTAVENMFIYSRYILLELHEIFFNEKLDEINDTQKISELVTLRNRSLLKSSQKNIFDEIRKYVGIKILNDYAHTDIKNIVHKIINNEMKNDFIYANNLLVNIVNQLQSIKKIINIKDNELVYDDVTEVHYGVQPVKKLEIVNTITAKIDNLHYIILSKIGSKIMDLYFIRKFLDKHNIERGLLYTGIDHSVHIIYILVKYFDFKITHISYSKIGLYELNNVIKNSDMFKNLMKYFFPKYLIQCIDITAFPQDLS